MEFLQQEALRDLRTKKTKLAEYVNEVQNLAQNKHRDSATKKLLDKSKSIEPDYCTKKHTNNQ